MTIKVRFVSDFPPLFTKLYGMDGSIHLRIRHFVSYE